MDVLYYVLILFLMSPLIFWVDSLNSLPHSQLCYTSQNHIQSLMVHYQPLEKVQSKSGCSVVGGYLKYYHYD